MGVGKNWRQSTEATKGGKKWTCPYDEERTAHQIATNLVGIPTLLFLLLGLILEEFCQKQFRDFFCKTSNPFSPVEHPICHILGMVGPKKEMSHLDATLKRVPLSLTIDLDLWHWIFKVDFCLRNGRPDCQGTEETVVDRMGWCETLKKLVHLTLRWLGYIWPWPWTLNFQGQIVSREWEARMSYNERDGTR